MEEDRALILRARSGDERAFSALAERHWERLVAVARSVVGDADAEDEAQESLVTAWRKLPRLREPDAFRAWLLRILLRRCLRRTRRRWAFLPLPFAADVADAGAGEGSGFVDVERILGALPPRQRAVMHLTVLEGMSDGEIGEALSIAAASVRSHRRRAREALRGLLAPSRNEGGAS